MELNEVQKEALAKLQDALFEFAKEMSFSIEEPNRAFEQEDITKISIDMDKGVIDTRIKGGY